jgi:hypothetical protein
MAMGQCPHCGRFLGALTATVRSVTGGLALDTITGACKRHGLVPAQGGFCWEDFFGEDEG